MIRTEVDKAVGRMGFVREDELAALRRHVQRLEGEISDLRTEISLRPTAGDADTVREPAPAPKKKIYLEDPDNG
jgi:cell division protein FtsB